MMRAGHVSLSCIAAMVLLSCLLWLFRALRIRATLRSWRKHYRVDDRARMVAFFHPYW
jgi:hypothetical protein